MWAEDELRVQTLRTGTPQPARPRRSGRPGAWLGPFRGWDGYRDAVLHALGREPEREPAPDREPAREREHISA